MFSKNFTMKKGMPLEKLLDEMAEDFCLSDREREMAVCGEHALIVENLKHHIKKRLTFESKIDVDMDYYENLASFVFQKMFPAPAREPVRDDESREKEEKVVLKKGKDGSRK